MTSVIHKHFLAINISENDHWTHTSYKNMESADLHIKLAAGYKNITCDEILSVVFQSLYDRKCKKKKPLNWHNKTMHVYW